MCIHVGGNPNYWSEEGGLMRVYQYNTLGVAYTDGAYRPHSGPEDTILSEIATSFWQ